MRRNHNTKGNAALVALLLVIIIVGIAASVMILAGRNSIDETDKYEKGKSSSTAAAVTTTVPAVTEPEKPKQLDLYAQQASDFKKTSINGFAAQASILIDATSDTALAGNNLDNHIFPASMTKVMTILVACENLNSYDDTYTFKEADLVKPYEQNATMAGFKAGEAVTARDMLYGAILPSGADACIGLANLVAGSETAFVKMMNQRAKELGLKNTNFVNTTGIHDPKHYSSVNDIAVIMKVANHNVTCRNVLNTLDYTTSKTTQNPEGIHLTCLLGGRLAGFYVDKNGNGQNDDTAKITGGKTGFTDEAGSCAATLCTDSENEHTYICVIARSSSSEKAIQDTIAMYEKYLPGSKAKIPDATTKATTTKAAAALAPAQ